MGVEVSDRDDPTEGGRWILVNGRRWRATDPTIPDPLRQELVNALMAGRRAVAAAHRTDDVSAEKVARAMVDDAKVALGERGEPWWGPPSEEGRRLRAQAAIRALSGGRAPGGTICPSDVARAIGGSEWRSLMELVRDEVRALAQRDVVTVSQGGETLDPSQQWAGPIRVRRTG